MLAESIWSDGTDICCNPNHNKASFWDYTSGFGPKHHQESCSEPGWSHVAAASPSLDSYYFLNADIGWCSHLFSAVTDSCTPPMLINTELRVIPSGLAHAKLSAGWVWVTNPSDNQQNKQEGGIHGNTAFFLKKKRKEIIYEPETKEQWNFKTKARKCQNYQGTYFNPTPFIYTHYIIILITWLHGFYLQHLTYRIQCAYWVRHQVSPCHSVTPSLIFLHMSLAQKAALYISNPFLCWSPMPDVSLVWMNLLSKHSPETKP